MAIRYTYQIHSCHVYIPNGHKIYQYVPFQGPPKYTQIGIFWFENIPSGNPGRKTHLEKLLIWVVRHTQLGRFV
jgi:hypothetical protein